MVVAISVPVEIFVIKRLNVLNLVVIFVAKLTRDTRTSFSSRWQKTPRASVARLAQSSIVSRVKGIVALLMVAGALTIAACSFFESGEAVREDSGRTLYRAAEENPTDRPDVTPLREKVPGETR
jgi:hypothetical protein